MATLSQNINQAISDFSSIKTAIQNKSVSVPSGTPTSQYASKINSIQTGITPTGTVQITQNGTTDVTNYASAQVNVPQPSGTISITENGSGIDVSQYASADVDVTPTITNDTNQIIQLISASSSLTSLNIPVGTTYVHEYLTYTDASGPLYSNLTSVSFPEGLLRIGDYAFAMSRIQGQIVFPSTLASIYVGAFSDCTGITSIVLPSSVTDIFEYAFNGCTSLTDIYYTGTQAQWNNIEIGEDAIPSGATIHYNYSLE